MADFFYTSFDVVTIDENGYRVEVIDDDVNVFNVTQNVSLGTLPTDSFGIVAEGSFNDGGFDVALNDVIEISHATYTRTARFVLKESLEAAYQAAENAVATYVADNDFADEFEPEALDIYLEDKNQPGQVPVLLGTVPRGKAVALPYQTAVTKDARLYGVPVTNNFLNDLQDPTQFPFTEFLIPGTTENIGVRSFADFFTDVTTLTDESDIGGAQWEPFYDAQILPNTLNLAGDEINAVYHGVFAANTNTKELRMSFGGVTFGSVSSQQSGLGWDYRVTIMRNGASSVRWSATLIDAANAISVGEIGMLDFTGNLTLTLQGRTETADGDLTAKKGKVLFIPALPPDVFPPSVPVVKSLAADSDTELTLSWGASTDNVGVTGYEVRIRLASGSYGAPVDVGNILDHQFTVLTAGTEYRAQVRAYDAAGNFSAWSNEVSATTEETPFDPSQIPGLVQWVEVRQVTGVTSGDPLPTWGDLSGEGNHATRQNSGDWPKYVEGDAPYIACEGGSSGNYYNTGDFSELTEGECYLVAQGAADPAATGLETGLWKYGTSADADLFPWTSGTVFCGWGSAVRKGTDDPTTPLTDWHSWNVWSAPSDFGMRLNGSSFFTTTTNTVGFSAACELGRAAETARRWGGNFAFYAMYSRKLTSGERTLMDAYVAQIISELDP